MNLFATYLILGFILTINLFSQNGFCDFEMNKNEKLCRYTDEQIYNMSINEKIFYIFIKIIFYSFGLIISPLFMPIIHLLCILINYVIFHNNLNIIDILLKFYN